MVQSIQLINSSITAGNGLSASGMPETGEFDFMSYLLGLSGTNNPENSILGEAIAEGSEVTTPLIASEKSKMDGLPLETSAPQEDSLWEGVSGALALTSVNLSQTLTPSTQDASGELPKNEVSLRREPQSEEMRLDVAPSDARGLSNESPKIDALQSKSEKDSFREVALQRYGVNSPPEKTSQLGSVEVTEKIGRASELLDKSAISDDDSKTETSSLNEALFSRALEGQTPLKAQTMETAIATGVAQHESVPASEIMNKIHSLVGQGGGKVTLSLTPPELGNVEIAVTARGKMVELEMKSQSAETKSLLESQLGDLQSLMKTQDLVLSKCEVSVHKDLNFASMDAFSATAFGSEPQNQTFNHRENPSQSSNFMNQAEKDHPIRSIQGPVAARAMAAYGNGRLDVRI